MPGIDEAIPRIASSIGNTARALRCREEAKSGIAFSFNRTAPAKPDTDGAITSTVRALTGTALSFTGTAHALQGTALSL